MAQDPHQHRNLQAVEEPLDAANQSLADALRASFSVLKGIMAVLLILYLFSNVKTIDPHEEAMILRFGGLRTVVNKPGLVWALPYPIDQIVLMPTRKSNDMLVASHTFHRSDNEIGKPLSFINRGPNTPLDPTLDGALLTADAGLVHAQWKVTYKIDNLRDFVTNIRGSTVEAAERLVKVMVETIGVHVAAEMTAEEVVRTRVDLVRSEIQRRINERLTELESGITVTLVEVSELTPPLQVTGAFDATQRAENAREQRIRGAEQQRTELLNEAAGAAHTKLAVLFDAIDRGGTQGRTVPELDRMVEQVLMDEAEGEAGRLLKNAGAYRSVVVSQMESDLERYRTLLPEYRRQPMVLLTRLWEEAKQEIFNQPGVTKIYRPAGLKEFRLKIPLDPEQRRAEEERRLHEQQFDVSKLRPTRIMTVGPGQE